MSKTKVSQCLLSAVVILSAVAVRGQGPENRWEVQLSNFFRGGTKPVYLYARERDGQWIAVVGSSRDPDRQGGKTYNRSWYYGDASLKATFLAPPRVRLDAGTENIQVRDARHGYHGPIRRVKATGGDEFFVVMTVQRDAPPAVETSGAGLKATAVVGKQTVRFDGKNIMLAPLK